jgi:hypothetical protein
MNIQTEVRNATLDDLVPLLQAQHEAKLDVVIPATNLRSEGALLKVKGITVFDDATIRPTAIMDGHIAQRLDIPVKYVRRLRAERPDLYDANFNGWIHGLTATDVDGQDIPADERNFLLRTFLDPDGGEGIGRALLSDRYAPIENLDVLMAALSAIQESGIDAQVVRSNLSETRMSVRFAAPGIAALAPELLKGYNAPVAGWGDLNAVRAVAEREGKAYAPGTEPVVFAGFDLDNSETGGGAFVLCPVITVQICGNGLRLDVAQVRKVHLGAQLEEGNLVWSQETKEATVALVKSQTKDAVKAFLDLDFLRGEVAKIEALAGVEVTDPLKTVSAVSKALAYTDEQAAGILGHFVKGGQMTAGGVLNAVTSFAQTVESPDEAFALEDKAVQTLELVAALR